MTLASNTTSKSHRPLGNTGLAVPPVIFGTSCLGNLYEVVADETKLAIVAEIIRQSPTPAVFDSGESAAAGGASRKYASGHSAHRGVYGVVADCRDAGRGFASRIETWPLSWKLAVSAVFS